MSDPLIDLDLSTCGNDGRSGVLVLHSVYPGIGGDLDADPGRHLVAGEVGRGPVSGRGAWRRGKVPPHAVPLLIPCAA